MKRNSKIILFVAALSAAGLAVQAGAQNRHGTDILHWSVSATMANEDVETNASGSVMAQQDRQGRADIQRMNITVDGLTPGATYELLAETNGNTNLVDAAEFTTDDNGSAVLDFSSQGKGRGRGHGGSGQPIPDALNPLSDVQEIEVGSISADLVFPTTNVVLEADLTNPDQFQYLVKRSFSTNIVTDAGTETVGALLQIKATEAETKFTLRVTGLIPSTDYLLAFNGVPVETNPYTSDSKGRLNIKSAPTPAPILTLQSVALWDASSNVVLSTTLP